MALLSIDKIKIELIVKVGVLETYQPDNDVEEIFKDVEELRRKLKSSRDRIIGKTKDNAHALKVLEDDDIKTKKWENYLNKTYAKQLEAIQKKINDKNIEICPNFNKIMSN